jgi:glycosyltransferase involved in cell wall biosynthesis
MKGNQSVTLVITCFNHGVWLAEAIESALSQTYTYLEIIVVDDGSTDNTAGVCSRYPSIRYFWQPNAGLSAARNTGLRQSTGEFICFLDADDRLMPEAIALGVDALTANPSWAFAFGGYNVISADRTLLRVSRADLSDVSYRSLLRTNIICMHATVLYRRSALELIGGFDTNLQACEDYDVYLRIARLYPIGYHDHILAEYRRHSANMSNDWARMLTTSLAVLRSQEKFVADFPEDRRALEEGLAFLQRIYGRPLIDQAIRSLADPALRHEAWAQLKLAARLAPRLLPFVVVRTATKQVARALEPWLPMKLRHALRRAARLTPPSPPPGRVRFGDLRRLHPIDGNFGFARGTPIDRFYIERFLATNMGDITGRVLEIGDNSYTIRYGAGKVTQSDVLHVSQDAPQATIVGDLTNALHIESNHFDCIILTQTLHLIFDLPSAVATLRRILKPQGVLLLTVPGISQTDRGEWGDSWYWSLTAASVRRLLAEGWSDLDVEVHGNVLSAISFLHGLSAEELTRVELESQDPAYQLVITARATKSAVDQPGS